MRLKPKSGSGQVRSARRALSRRGLRSLKSPRRDFDLKERCAQEWNLEEQMKVEEHFYSFLAMRSC